MLFAIIAFGYLFWANPDLAHTVASLSRKGQPLPDEYLKHDDVITFGGIQLLGMRLLFPHRPAMPNAHLILAKGEPSTQGRKAQDASGEA